VTSVWSKLWVVAVVAFALGHFRTRRVRQISLAALMVLPIIILTAGLALVPPTPPSFLMEWPRAMALALPWFASWLCLAIVGYFAARWSVR
jgi:hypothetical protein